MIILEIKANGIINVLSATHETLCHVNKVTSPTWAHCTCGAPSDAWVRVGNHRSFIDTVDAEVWGERYYPRDVRRIREADK